MGKWQIKKARYGEHQKYLDDGFEPFAVVSKDTSYSFLNTSIGKRETQHQSQEYIYFRKKQETK